jgi:hypothetical protein
MIFDDRLERWSVIEKFIVILSGAQRLSKDAGAHQRSQANLGASKDGASFDYPLRGCSG